MFAHIFKYRLKCLLRDRETIFWTIAFPLILAVFFNLALSNVNKGEIFKAIDIAVVNNEQYQADLYFKAALGEASKGDDRLFSLTEASMEDAEKMLDKGAISGYIIVDPQIKLVVNKSGMSQNIIKSFLDNYIQTASAAKTILAANPAGQQELLRDLGDRRQYVREVSGTGANPDNVLTYFYALIAMACFYGSFFGLREVTDIQADISPLAARVNTAPIHKLKAFISSMSAAFVIHMAEMLALLAFLRFALRIDFGPKAGYILLTAIAGSMAGITFGALISAIVKKSENIKISVMIAVSMTGSFLAGMMYQNIKYIIAQKIPALSFINPISLIADAFYCLYYYDTYTRYLLNMVLLAAFTIVFCSGIYLIVRRRKYASL